MFGKLTLNDIPYTSTIIMSTLAMMILIVVIVAVLLTRYQKWSYFWHEWLCSVDHKRIGIMYIVLSLIMLLRGYADGIMMRVHQSMAFGESQGYLPPEHYNQIFSAHGVIMIIFMAMPFMTGLMNIIIPLQLGKRDVAFPFMNSVGLWLTVGGAMLMMVSLFIGEFSMAGWSGYPPYSEKTYSPGVGVDYWIWALTLSGAGSTMTGINFIVTILQERAPGMTLMRMPMFVWTTLCTSILIVLSFPALTVSTLLLALDRYAGMHFFTNDFGGNMMNYINLFWIWGHPEVYIVILPAFGIFSEVIATFSGKKLHGHNSLVSSVMVIAVLSFSVWLHHFFTMGASTNVNAVFGIATMLIAFPTGVKIFNWLLTMYRGRLRFEEPMLWALAFLPSFAVGGATGVLLAVPPVDFMMHNSEFLIAHFHNVLIPGALFGFVSGYVYWFPKAFGFRLDPYWGKLSFWFWLVGFYLAFMPLYVLGLMGMPRRMQHYLQPDWQPWLHVATFGAICIFIGIACMIIQLIVSVNKRQQLADATGDPWDGRNLEWSMPSPPPIYNFAVIPKVESIDAFHHIKKYKQANPETKDLPLEPIILPKNTGLGFIFGVLAFLWAFAMVWEIWWLAVTAIFGLITILVVRSWDDDHEFTLSVDEIRSIERQHSQVEY